MIKRTIYDKILNSINNRPITLITGARQVGKSTLCHQLVKDLQFNYVSLDDIYNRGLAIKDPEMFLQLNPCPLIIDEVQYAPNLFDRIEAIVNKQKFETGNNYGMFVLTGSEVYKLMEGVTQSMAGRVSIINMSPLSVSEINNVYEEPFELDILKKSERVKKYKIHANKLYEYIVNGMYPELYDNHNLDKNEFYSNYVDTYINRDVTNIINISDKLKFQNFMEILASLTGEQLVYDTVAKACGVTIPTIKSWISVLVAGDIIYLLESYNEMSAIKRVSRKCKIYFKDTGLACYLAKLNDPEILKRSRFAGNFVETYIINEIMKSYLNNNVKPNFYYYRDNDQKEIDLVILDKGKINFIECKSGTKFNSLDIKAFNTLEAKTKYEIGGKCIICNTEGIYKIDDTFVLPITAI